MAGSLSISANGPRGGRLLVEAAVALRVSDLRTPWGWIHSHTVQALDGSRLELSVNVPPGADYGWLRVDRWPAGFRWSTSRIDVPLFSRPRHLGGTQWLFRCPETYRPASALYLSPDGTRLASRQALGLAHRSQHQRAPARAAARAARIRADLGGDGTARPKGMWTSTFDRMSAELAQLDRRSSETGPG